MFVSRCRKIASQTWPPSRRSSIESHRKLRMPRTSMKVINDVITRASTHEDLIRRHSIQKRLYISLCQTIARLCDTIPKKSQPIKGCACIMCACTINRLQYEAGVMGFVLTRPNPVGSGEDPTLRDHHDLTSNDFPKPETGRFPPNAIFINVVGYPKAASLCSLASLSIASRRCWICRQWVCSK